VDEFMGEDSTLLRNGQAGVENDRLVPPPGEALRLQRLPDDRPAHELYYGLPRIEHAPDFVSPHRQNRSHNLFLAH
jgi:hypothetical protein